MQSVPVIQLVWELHQAGLHVDNIASKVGRHRATIYRWLRGIRHYGIREFLRRYQNAKKGRRQKRKTHGSVKALIYEIREEHNHCCGEKVQYWMKKLHDITISVSTIYRVLAEKYKLRSKWKKNTQRGPVPRADKPRQVVQVDTVDLGELYAFTAVDIYTREVWVTIENNLEAKTGAKALSAQMQNMFGHSELIQRDGGPEFGKAWQVVAEQHCNRVRTSRPYKKNEQAYIESFNRSLRKECVGWGKYKKRQKQILQAKVDKYLQYYNYERPHLSLNLATPKNYLSHLR